MKPIKFAFFLILPVLILMSCAKENDANGPPGKQENNNTGQMVVKLTDEYADTYAPTPGSSYRYMLDEVNVEILQVSIHYDEIPGDTSTLEGWVDLETNAGIYDLIEISNITVVLANGGMLPPGHISQMRLLLGNNNSVVVDSVSYELKTPGAQQSGLKIKADFTVLPNAQYEIVLDFDSDASIVVQENGQFLLNPVIRIAGIIELSPPPVYDGSATESLYHTDN